MIRYYKSYVYWICICTSLELYLVYYLHVNLTRTPLFGHFLTIVNLINKYSYKIIRNMVIIDKKVLKKEIENWITQWLNSTYYNCNTNLICFIFLAQLNQLNQQNGINGHPGTTSELEVVRIVELLDPADPEDGRLLDSQNNDIKQRLRSCSRSSNEEEQSEKDSDSLLDKENVSWLEKVDVEKRGRDFWWLLGFVGHFISFKASGLLWHVELVSTYQLWCMFNFTKRLRIEVYLCC